ncbi:MAG: hypothetical protein WBN09_06505 [Woeseiaceae bacterium]
MTDEEYRGAQQWSRDKQSVAVVIWISFLVAALGTMLFFAVFDPAALATAIDDNLEVNREAGYAIGFFFFWILSAASAAVTAWLVRTAPKRTRKRR